jgi:hypothetical protein
LTVSILTVTLNGQDLCKVLMPSISSSYTGPCKQGLADGKGEAIGVDRYVGDFKKGLPDGEGTYFWQTGQIYKGRWRKGLRNGQGEYTIRLAGRDSVITGIWKDDKYIGKKELAPYVIGYRSNVGRVTCMKIGDDQNYVKYKFSRSGGESASSLTISDLIMQGSSGTENMSYNFTGFERVTFPFEGKIKFSAPNETVTAVLNCEVRLTINEPGQWQVTIFY